MKSGFIKILTVLLLILTVSCRKNAGYTSNAEIIGYDYRACVCCGGTEIAIDNTNPPNGSFFLISQMPSYYKIDKNATFPIKVKVDYAIDTSGCYGNYVKILKIANR